MYGIPKDLPIQAFIGKECNQVCLGRSQIELRFPGTGGFCIEGDWELRNDQDRVVDADVPHGERKSYRLHLILHSPVLEVSLDAPHSCTLHFANGLRLTLFDDRGPHECFQMYLDEGRDFIC
jgi:hypothetical protein